MHPLLIEPLIQQRRAELRHRADQRQLGQLARIRPIARRHSLRQRFGWLLVEWGLRLAVRPP